MQHNMHTVAFYRYQAMIEQNKLIASGARQYATWLEYECNIS